MQEADSSFQENGSLKGAAYTYYSSKEVQNNQRVIIILSQISPYILCRNKRKIDQYVNYPLYDLDMSPFLHGHDNLEERKSDDEKYDLYAIIVT
jgi:hypothetical protein